MGSPTPAQNPVYTPGVSSETPAAVVPSGIPETVKNVNKPRLSKMLIILGVIAGLLIIASASYLLLFSKNQTGSPEDTISLPVTNQAPLTQPKQIATPAPVESAAPAVASSSASPAASSSSSAC
jgi:hypothetical protein